jgi:hypothetical protein
MIYVSRCVLNKPVSYTCCAISGASCLFSSGDPSFGEAFLDPSGDPSFGEAFLDPSAIRDACARVCVVVSGDPLV